MKLIDYDENKSSEKDEDKLNDKIKYETDIR